MNRLIKFTIAVAIILRLIGMAPAARDVAMSPIRMAEGVVAGVELYNLRKVIVMEKSATGRYPDRAEFSRLIQRCFRSRLKAPRLDSWGQPYQYRRLARGFELRSTGPNRTPGSADDIVMTWRDP